MLCESPLFRGDFFMPERINKARYWWAVLWTENLSDDWQEKIYDTIQYPFAYCIHDTDTDSKSEHRKDHVHLIIAFPNTTTYKHALNVFKLLGDNAVNTCEACISIRHCYDYLIHDTESCSKADKHLYDPECRVTGNGFDIGLFEQLGAVEKKAMRSELITFCKREKFVVLGDFDDAVEEHFPYEYLDVLRDNTSLFERYCKSNYLKWKKEFEEKNNVQ